MIQTEITLVTGACRSGKSHWAQSYAESLSDDKCYIATCPVLDEEMRQRVERHQKDREGMGWKTVEAPYLLKEAIEARTEAVVLVDCLTLWASNLMFQAEQNTLDFGEDEASTDAQQLVENLPSSLKHLIFVTNEVGWGIVPENALARQFRDISGRINQSIASQAHRVILTVCGIPTAIKGNLPQQNEHRP